MTGRKFILMTLLAALLAAGFCLSAAAEEAENLTEKCTVKMSSHSERAKRITDGDYRTYWESAETENPWVTITSPDPVYGLYLCFQKKPESYEIQRASGDDWVTVTAGDVRFHHVFYEMDGVKKIRIRATGASLRYPVPGIPPRPSAAMFGSFGLHAAITCPRVFVPTSP